MASGVIEDSERKWKSDNLGEIFFFFEISPLFGGEQAKGAFPTYVRAAATSYSSEGN